MKAELAEGCTALQFGGWVAAPLRLKPQTRLLISLRSGLGATDEGVRPYTNKKTHFWLQPEVGHLFLLVADR
jgi:hypothetical protein